MDPPSTLLGSQLTLGVALLLLLLFFRQIFYPDLGKVCPASQEKGYAEVGLFPHEIPRPSASAAARLSAPGGLRPAEAAAAAAPLASAASTAGYSQPASKQQQWFDIKQLGGFVQVPLALGALSPSTGTPLHDKWIVVTTINAPTPTIEKLATLKDWRVVVVGDTKTPKDWAYPGITYLSVEAQVSLGFSVTQLLRTRSYQRKNIGYLYAILHGARTIYETDDDNALQVDAVPIVQPIAYMLEYASSELTINHHAHFGQPSTWPRGYPLEAIGDPPQTSVRRASVIPAVQQGLANGDPDMDAVFRLTRKPRDTRIDFAFDPGAEPIALPMGSFGPYNAQNTVFTYEGLWATVLPQTVEFRVCDIWRAYFTQRLLWGVGAQLAFVAPYVYQLRNSHSYHDDYVSEKQIFDQVTRLLHFLRQWRCAVEDIAAFSASSSAAASALPACAYALSRDLAVGGYWGPADAELVRHFYHDLLRVGYVFPQWVEPLAQEPAHGLTASEAEAREKGPWVGPCAAGKGGSAGGAGGAGCKDASAPKQEAVDYSLPSIVLPGTCPSK